MSSLKNHTMKLEKEMGSSLHFSVKNKIKFISTIKRIGIGRRRFLKFKIGKDPKRRKLNRAFFFSSLLIPLSHTIIFYFFIYTFPPLLCYFHKYKSSKSKIKWSFLVDCIHNFFWFSRPMQRMRQYRVKLASSDAPND